MGLCPSLRSGKKGYWISSSGITSGRLFRRRQELLFGNLLKLFAENLGLFAAASSSGRQARTSGFGFEEVLKEPEFEDRELSVRFAHLVDNLDEAAEKFREASEDPAPRVFIGEEHPFRPARDFGTVMLRFKNEKLGDTVIFAIGPKRMNYERASSLLDFAFRDIMKEF